MVFHGKWLTIHMFSVLEQVTRLDMTS